MATFNFDQFLESVKNGVADLATTEASGFVDAARRDGEAFVDATKEDLLVWTRQLADGLLSKDEFEFLVKGKKDLAKMEALTQAGAGAAKVEKVRTGVLNIVLSSALSML